MQGSEDNQEQFQQMYSWFVNYSVKVGCDIARSCHNMSFENGLKILLSDE